MAKDLNQLEERTQTVHQTLRDLSGKLVSVRTDIAKAKDEATIKKIRQSL